MNPAEIIFFVIALIFGIVIAVFSYNSIQEIKSKKSLKDNYEKIADSQKKLRRTKTLFFGIGVVIIAAINIIIRLSNIK